MVKRVFIFLLLSATYGCYTPKQMAFGTGIMLTNIGQVIYDTDNCGDIEAISSLRLSDIKIIQELDKKAAFSFSIMSDNKGDSPYDNIQMERMVKWIKESGDAFVIGLGDHVARTLKNTFLTFLKKDSWWSKNFYPNIADGENEFYGKSQSDWCGGADFLKVAGLDNNPNVVIRENGCEYYAKLHVKDYTVHLIQLHYPDEPFDKNRAFPIESRQYLVNTLMSIDKSPKDIIIAAAHSQTGFWLDELSKEQLSVVMERCDLVLSATIHCWARKKLSGYCDRGPLVINTGSISYPFLFCNAGYVQVHVLEKPLSLIVQYIDADLSERELQHGKYSFVKILGGNSFNCF